MESDEEDYDLTGEVEEDERTERPVPKLTNTMRPGTEWEVLEIKKKMFKVLLQKSPGMQRLITASHIVVRQKVTAVGNKYTVTSESGDVLFNAKENPESMFSVLGASQRSFIIDLYVTNQDHVMSFRRPKWGNGSKLEVSVFGVVTSLVRKKSLSSEKKLYINDARNVPLLRLKKIWLSPEFELQTSNKQRIGYIEKQWSGLCRELFTTADQFLLKFPSEMDVRHKAAVLGACFLISDGSKHTEAGEAVQDEAAGAVKENEPSEDSEQKKVMKARPQTKEEIEEMQKKIYRHQILKSVGMRSLMVASQVNVRQKVTAFGNKYVITAQNGDLMFNVKENTDSLYAFFGGNKRCFTIDIYDANQHRVISLTRPSHWFGSCKMEVWVYGVMTHVVRRHSFSDGGVYINDAQNRPLLHLKKIWLTPEYELRTMEKRRIGCIQKGWSGLCRELFTSADQFVIKFQQELDVRVKSAIIEACILIDFIHYESK